MYDETQSGGYKIDAYLDSMNDSCRDIVFATDKGSTSKYDGWGSNITPVHNVIKFVNQIDSKINTLTDETYNFINKNMQGEGAFTSYGLLTNNFNPLVETGHGKVTCTDLITKLNYLQQLKADVLRNVINASFNNNFSQVQNIINEVCDRTFVQREGFFGSSVGREQYKVSEIANCEISYDTDQSK